MRYIYVSICLGIITEVHMAQTAQSQFLSLSKTLCEIVLSLNENGIPATFEEVVRRLSNGFDSVILPPTSAIKYNLDILVNELRLFLIKGHYYHRSVTPFLEAKEHTQLTKTLNKTCKSKNELKNYEQRKTQVNITAQTKIKKNKRTQKTKKSDKSNTFKTRKLKQFLPRKRLPYKQLHDVDNKHEEKHSKDEKKEGSKESSFLAKVSRLFKMDDNKLKSSTMGKCKTKSDVSHWKYVDYNNKKKKLLSDQIETQTTTRYQHSNCGYKNFDENEQEKHESAITDKVKHRKHVKRTKANRKRRRLSDNKRKHMYFNEKSCESFDQCLEMNKERQENKETRKFSSSYVKLKKMTITDSKSRKTENWKIKKANTSHNFRIQDDIDSFSSDNSPQYPVSSDNFSEDETTDDDQHQNTTSSTRAICGDLEQSLLSLKPCHATSPADHTLKNNSPDVRETGTSRRRNDDNNSENHTSIQLIGIL